MHTWAYTRTCNTFSSFSSPVILSISGSTVGTDGPPNTTLLELRGPSADTVKERTEFQIGTQKHRS